MIAMCGACGVNAARVPGLSGAWVGERKIGAIGVRISRWITSHGLALNVSTDLSYFDLIVACGIADRGVTSLARELGRDIAVRDAADLLVEAFEEVLERRAVPAAGL